MSAAWSHDGADAFAQACMVLDLKGAQLADIVALVRALPMLTFYRDGRPIGALVIHDDAPHIGVLPQWRRRWMTKSVLVAVRKALSATKLAKISSSNVEARWFARRLGWVESGIEDNYVIYRPAVA